MCHENVRFNITSGPFFFFSITQTGSAVPLDQHVLAFTGEILPCAGKKMKDAGIMYQ